MRGCSRRGKWTETAWNKWLVEQIHFHKSASEISRERDKETAGAQTKLTMIAVVFVNYYYVWLCYPFILVIQMSKCLVKSNAPFSAAIKFPQQTEQEKEIWGILHLPAASIHTWLLLIVNMFVTQNALKWLAVLPLKQFCAFIINRNTLYHWPSGFSIR